jgi:hypothetical protein
VVIEGNGAALDGTRPVPSDAWEHVQGDVFRFRPREQQFQRLYLGGKPAARVEASEFDLQPPALEPLQWCRHEGYLYFRTQDGLLPGSYDLSYTHEQVGITIYEARYFVIRNLVVQGFRLDGVNAHDNAIAVLRGLDCRENGRSGISIGGASQVKLRDCRSQGNGAAQVRTEGFCTVEITACTLVPDTAPPLVVEGGNVLVDGQPFAQGE